MEFGIYRDMKNKYWFFLIISAMLYALPFLFSEYVWWLIFLFPVPLLYVLSSREISFLQSYIWGCVVFGLHLSGGIYLVASMAHDLWFIGFALGVVGVLYQALLPALIFCFLAYGIRFFNITTFFIRLCIYAIGLWLFIVWIDWYSMCIFGVKEGYPLMHPLIVLAQKPQLLWLMSIIGKQLCTALFLLISVGCVLPFTFPQFSLYSNWGPHRNKLKMVRWVSGIGIVFLILIFSLYYLNINNIAAKPLSWYCQVKSLPYMACATGKDPTVIVTIVSCLLKKIIKDYPEVELIIMPESAFNINDFAKWPEVLQLWNADRLGKPIHFIFGASRCCNNDYYNSLHWVYNGVLQDCYDKRHVMLMSERLSPWMDNAFFRRMYFNEASSITTSSIKRKSLKLLDKRVFVPYICSELFFNETPDDDYDNAPIIVIVNDSLFISNMYSSYIAKLLVLLAQFKAIQWQRDIVYVSYTQSLFIDKRGIYHQM